MKYVYGFLELGKIHRTIRTAAIICPNLPNGRTKTMPHFRALMLLPKLRLV